MLRYPKWPDVRPVEPPRDPGKRTMSEHLIRLRGGWEVIDPGAGDGPSRRLELPLRGSPDPGRYVRLIRRFGRPPIAAPRQSVWLRIARAPGLTGIKLNGSMIPLEGKGSQPEEIPMQGLRPRNELEIEVPPLAQGHPEWGEFTIVIRDAPAPEPRVRPLA